MMKLIFEQQQPELLAWAVEHGPGADKTFGPNAIAAGVVDEHDRIRAVFVMESTSVDTARVHISSDLSKEWATPRVIRAVFLYAFTFRKMRKLTALMPYNRSPAIVFALKSGFQFEGHLREHWPNGEDAVLLGMTKAACLKRYIKSESED